MLPRRCPRLVPMLQLLGFVAFLAAHAPTLQAPHHLCGHLSRTSPHGFVGQAKKTVDVTTDRAPPLGSDGSGGEPSTAALRRLPQRRHQQQRQQNGHHEPSVGAVHNFIGGITWFGANCLALLVILAAFAGAPKLVAAEDASPNTGAGGSSSSRMSAVAPCLLSKCQLPLAKCVLNPACAANLTCIIGCTGAPDEKTCQIKCGDNFENDVVDEFNSCALSSKRCVPQRPDVGPLPGELGWTPVKGRYPVPPPESVAQDFDVGKMSGRWYITAGLNPLFDLFPCQVHFFEGTSPQGNQPGRLLGKINWRISEPDGEFLTRSTVQKFVQTSPGVFENHDNEYLHYQDDWFVLDHGNEENPDLGFVLIYYRGRNDAWAGYGGGTLYTRSPKVTPEILEKVCEATAKANVPFYKYWKITDNTCPTVTDPIKMRSQYLEKLLEQGELSVEEQLTYIARSAYSEVDKDERYVLDGARRIERMTEDFVRNEVEAIASVEKEVEKELGVVEKELEKEEVALETPIKQFLHSIIPSLFG